MASNDEWEVSLLVSEIVLAFTLLSAVLTFLSAAYAFPATVPVTEQGDPPEKKTIFAAYPKSFKSLCFIEALATCVASIVLFVFGLDRHAYWLVIFPATWQSLAFARSLCLRMMYAPLGWLLIPAACVIDMATAGFFVGAVVCAYQSSETSAKVLTLIPSILSGICVAVWTSYFILQINKMPPEAKSKSRNSRHLFIVITVQQICSILSFASFRVSWQPFLGIIVLPHLTLAVLQVLAPPRRVKLWVRKSCTEVWARSRGPDLADSAALHRISSSGSNGGYFPKGGDEAGDLERAAFGNDVPGTLAETFQIGIMDCTEGRKRFPKQPHIALAGYRFLIQFVNPEEAKEQDILIDFPKGGDPVVSCNKATGSSQITVCGQAQDAVEYVQSVLCSKYSE
ncbi:hypothetical protein PG985_005446 [Apiospora marii]|uniref:uncharacterized protein n=1 Tax=Apiospora marii TaxID=335849 RepID=UPI00312F93BD